MSLPLPGADGEPKPFKQAPKPPAGKLTREYLLELILHFYRRYRALSRQDSVGCAIAYCSLFYLPRGVSLKDGVGIAGQVLAEFMRLVPDAMEDAEFIPKLAYAAPLLPEIPLRLYHSWAAVFDSHESPKDERERVLKLLWIVEIVPHSVTRDEEKREIEAAIQLARKRGKLSPTVDAEEVRSELWLAEKLPLDSMYRKEDGTFALNKEGLKDALLRPEIRDKFRPIAPISLDAAPPSGEGALGDTVRAPEAGDPSERLELLALLRELVELGRARGLAIDAAIEYESVKDKESREEVAKRCGVTVEALRHAGNWLHTEVEKRRPA